MYQCIQLPWTSRPGFGSYTGSESFFTSLCTGKSLSLVKDRTMSSGSTCCFSVALVTKKRRYFPGNCEAAGGKAATPPILGICFHRNSKFLYYLSKSAANFVLKRMSAVIAIAHVLVVIIKSLSMSIMLLEYSFGKLNMSLLLCLSGFLGSSPVSASIFLLMIFQRG